MPERHRDPPFDRHLDEAPPRRAEALPDRHQVRDVVAGVAGQDQVGGQAALRAAAGVHLRRVQHARRILDERFDELGGPAGLLGVVERLGDGDAVLERLQRHAERALLPVRGVGVRHLRGERALRMSGSPARRGARRWPAARTRRRAARPSRSPPRASACESSLGKVAADAAVDDLAVLLRREVHADGEVAVAEVHPRARAPRARRVRGAAAAGRTRGWRTPRCRTPARCPRRRWGRAPRSLRRKAIQHRRARRLQRGPPVELRDRVVARGRPGRRRRAASSASSRASHHDRVLHDEREVLGIEARPAHQRAVDLGVRHELADVRRPSRCPRTGCAPPRRPRRRTSLPDGLADQARPPGRRPRGWRSGRSRSPRSARTR